MPRYGTIDREFATRLASCPSEEDGPVLMVNFMRYRERASYGDQRAAMGDVTGREADDRYAPLEILADIGAAVVFAGDVTDGGPERWDRVGIVRYATRRSFIEMQSRRDFQEKHVHKDAGMEFTVVLAATPLSDPGAQVPTGSVRFVAWPEGAAPAGLSGTSAVLAVEGRIIGDERRFGHLTVHADDSGPAVVPAGAIDVTTRPTIDRLRDAIARWPGAAWQRD